MNSYQLGNLCSQANRTTQEGEEVLAYLEGDLGFPLPDEWVASVMLAAAEPANLADQLRETEARPGWLRVAKVAAYAIKAEVGS